MLIMVLIFQGTIGLQITVLTSCDLTSATSRKLKVVKPDGTNVTWTPTCPVPSDGKLYYTTVAADLTLFGDYFLQAYAEFGTDKYYGDIVKFRVTEKKVT